MKRLAVFCLFIFASLASYSQNCNITVVSTQVNCFGEASGKAEIRKDGQLIVFGNGNNNGNPGTCVSPETSSFSCGSPVSGALVSTATSGVVEIPDGKILYLAAASFNGSIRFLGANTLVVCGSATIQNFEMNNNSKPITIIVNGQASISSSNINLDYQSIVRNYGVLSFTNSIGFNGKLFNHGSLTASQDLSINANTGQMYNAGSMVVNGSFNNFNTATNGGQMQVNGNFHNNGGSAFINLCTINVGNEFINSTTMENSGKITVATTTRISGGKLYKGNSGSLLQTQHIIIDGTLDGIGTACAGVKVAGTTTINGSGIVKGKLDLCDATGIETNTGQIQSPATTNCSCPASGSGSGVSGTVTWSAGSPILGGSTVTGLIAGSYSVTVALDGCNPVTLNFTITTPAKIMGTVSVGGTTATVNNVTGGNTGGYSYDWKQLSTNTITNTTSNSRNFTTAGDYTVTIKDSKGCLSDPLLFTISGQGTTCNFTTVVTPVTCRGGSDGSVVIYKDGQPLNVPTNGGGGSGTGTTNPGMPTGNPGSCIIPSNSSFSCSSLPGGATAYTLSSGTVTVSAGQTKVITSPTFSGDLSITGGTLVICGNATIQNFNYGASPGAFTLIINGTASLNAPNLNLLSSSIVKNYGSLTTSSIGFNGTLENHGTLTVNGDLSFNSSVNSYLNTGSITVTGNFNNKFTTINGGNFWVKGIFNNNEPVSMFNNYCKLIVDGSLNSNKFIDNRGYIIVATSTTTFNSNSYYKGYAGSVLYTKNFINNSTVEGIESCASVRVTNTTTLNGPSIIKGFLSLCDANAVETNTGQVQSPATLNCSCGGTTTTTSNNPVVWNGFPTVTGNTNSNLPAGTYTVTITWPGCNTVTLTYTITQPASVVSATVSVSNATANASAPTGGNGGPYKYKWSPDNLITNVGSRTYTSNGNYTVTVLDSKNCEGPPLPFTITGVPETNCNTIVNYQANNMVLVKIECPEGDCNYQIQTASGDVLAYGATIPRPCKDSVIRSVNCEGDIIETGVNGSGNCTQPCNPATDPNCPCNISTDANCPPTGCDPQTDPDCPCKQGVDPNCITGCDENDPNDCPCDPKLANCPPCNSATDPGCSYLGIDYNAFPGKCGIKGYVVLTITNGSGSYTVYNNKNTGPQGSGSSPITMYNLPEGISLVTIVDNLTQQTRNITVNVPPTPVSNVTVATSANAGSNCNNQVTINITNAVSGPYTVDLGCCAPWYIDNQNAVNGSLQLGPYTITSGPENEPYRIRVTDANCNTYDDMITACNINCNTPASIAYVPAFTKVAPSYEGRKDGSITLTNLPSGVTAYWTGTGLFSRVQGTTLSGIGKGNYQLMLLDNATHCRYYYSPADETLSDGPTFEVKFILVAGCNYETQLSKENADGTPNNTAIAQPVTYTWYNQSTGAPIATGKQINISAIAASLTLDYITVKVADALGNKAEFTFKIPDACKPPVSCTSQIKYKAIDPLCHDGNNGSIEITSVSAGNSISWVTPALQTPGINDLKKTGLEAGRYTVAIRSNTPGCSTETVDIYLNNPAALEVSKEELASGGVTIHVANGKAPYQTIWTDNNQNVSTRTDLKPGTTYTVNVTDANNCPFVYNFLYDPCALSRPQPLVSLRGTIATVINSHGMAPYSYNWKGGEIFDRTLVSQQNLANGIYEVVVTDARGCADSIEFNSDKCGETITIDVTEEDSRSDLCDGQATLSLAGVTNYTGYAILWDKTPLLDVLKYSDLQVLKSQSVLKFVNACAGPHMVAVITPGRCVVETPFIIDYTTIPPVECEVPLSITNPNGTSFTRNCYSDQLNVVFSVQGGIAPYIYNWSVVYPDNSTDEYTSDKAGLTNPDPGVYTVTVNGGPHCPAVTATYTITGPSNELDFTHQSLSPSCTGANGTLQLSITGGVAPYTITWADATSNTSSSGIVNKQLPAGILQTFTVSDSKGCSKEGAELIADQPFTGRIYNNRSDFCPGKDPVSLSAEIVPGYTFVWQGAGINDDNQYESLVRIGVAGVVNLVYTPTTLSGCTQPFTRSITITERTAEACRPSSLMCDVIDIEVPPIVIVDQCTATMQNVTHANVEARYFAYIQEAKQNFINSYVKAVMEDGLTEDLTIDYSDNEHHYTLYYYDQAGNLVRTVPPAGVKPLTASETTTAINLMKAGSTDQVFTQHTLATTYQYNSLNQLISQDMPDHNQQDLWEGETVLTLPNGEQVSLVDYTSSSNGLLFANTATETKLYKTSDAGKTWAAGLGIQFSDILDINTSAGANPAWYAVGKNGLFLKGSVNGSVWMLFSSPTSQDLINVYFSSTNAGRIMASDGTIWRTSDGGLSWLPANITLKNVNLSSISEVWNEGNVILVAGQSASPAASVLYYSSDGGSTFNKQEFTAGPFGAIGQDGTALLIGTGNGMFLKVLNGTLSVHSGSSLNTFVRQLIVKPGSYTALVTTDQYATQGNIYTSTDGKTWTAVTTTNTITKLSELNGTQISAVTNAGTYGNNSNWSSFGVVNATNVSGGGTTQVSNIFKSQYLSGALLNNTSITGGLSISDREVILGSAIAYRTSSTAWQKVDISNYWQATRTVHVNAVNDWLLAGGDNNLYRTRLGTGTQPNNTLVLTNGNAAVLTNVYDIYSLSNGVYALKTDNNSLVKLTLNANGTVTPTTQYALPGGVNPWMIIDVKFTANGSGADMLMTLNDGTIWQKIGTGAWTNKTYALQPNNLKAATSATDQNMYAAGSNSEIYKKINGDNNNFQWRLQKLNTATATDLTDAYLEAGALRLATNAGMKTYNAGTFTLTDEAGVSSTVNEAYSNVAVTADGKIYSRNAGTWSLNYTDPAATSITDVTTNLASGTQSIYFYQSGAWSKALPIKVQPVTAMAQGNKLIAVGNQGTVLVSADQGSTWMPSPLGVTQNLTAAASFGNNAVIGSENGNLYYSNNAGTSWTPVTTVPGTGPIRSIVMTGNNSVWVVRGTSVLYSSTLNTYNTALTSTSELHSVHVSTEGYGYVVGDAGTAYRIQPAASITNDQKLQASCTTTPVVPTPLLTTGLSALKICTDTDITDTKGTGMPVRALRSVSFTDRLTGYITGTLGLVLKTTDGGYHWKPEDAGPGTATPILAMADAQNGTLVNANGEVESLRDRSQKMASRFWYDELGRLVLSQNSKQYNIENYNTSAQNSEVPGAGKVRAYTYNLYDDIGRVVEVGEILTREELPVNKNESQVLYSNVKENFISDLISNKREITRTYYDEASFDNIMPGFDQQNLRSRVASVTYQDGEGTAYDNGTHYSYDIHGNVKTLVQEMRVAGKDLRKSINYEYDLVSGKVNYLYFQKGGEDQFIHKYEYDGDNRVTKVYTSKDGEVWDNDASYQYYAHGPLARTEIGEQKVEIQNYAYTLQGWIKGMKGDNFSYALGFHSNDYVGIGTGTLQATPIGKNLFNGNIATMTTNTPKFEEQGLDASLTQQFDYDQLNRIKQSTVLGGTHISSFKTIYAYDANGNIESLYRYDVGGNPLDQLKYNYQNKNNGYLANTNKLLWVDDAVNSPIGIDIQDQMIDNYSHDDIGNLSKDLQEDIEKIHWTVYGKVKSVIRKTTSFKSGLEFEYDANSNKIAKIVKENGKTKITYYFRDPQGNIMSVYEQDDVTELPELAEQSIYGSGRIGLLRPGTFRNEHVLGFKSYELNDHLGNVHVVLSDLKTGPSSSNVLLANEYYPFGMSMPGRSYTSSLEYRYGLNGMEKNSEFNLSKDCYDFGSRIYDARLGRWLSIDPLYSKYTDISPYAYAANSPLYFIDIDGEDIVPTFDISYAGKMTIKTIHDFGSTSVGAFNYVPGQNGAVGTLKININIVMNYRFVDGPFAKVNPDAKFNKENPGLHNQVLEHEKSHKEQLFEIIQNDNFSLTINGQEVTGKIDQVYHRAYVAINNNKKAELNRIKEFEKQHGPLPPAEKEKLIKDINARANNDMAKVQTLLTNQINSKLYQRYSHKDVINPQNGKKTPGVEIDAIERTVRKLSGRGEAYDYQVGKEATLDGKKIPQD